MHSSWTKLGQHNKISTSKFAASVQECLIAFIHRKVTRDLIFIFILHRKSSHIHWRIQSLHRFQNDQDKLCISSQNKQQQGLEGTRWYCWCNELLHHWWCRLGWWKSVPELPNMLWDVLGRVLHRHSVMQSCGASLKSQHLGKELVTSASVSDSGMKWFLGWDWESPWSCLDVLIPAFQLCQIYYPWIFFFIF